MMRSLARLIAVGFFGILGASCGSSDTGGTTVPPTTTLQCAATQTVCNNACVDLKSDGANCGACGTTCATGTVCSAGACASTCMTGTTQCGTSCVNFTNDANNCGACGTVCATGKSCSAGSCACNAPTSLCGDSCVDMSQDKNNCGTCGTVCSGALTCQAGACSLLPYGTGSDGNKMVTADESINPSSSPVGGTAGAATITLTIPDSFQAGQTILMHQSQGAGAGVWELATIKSVSGGTAVLGANLVHTYTSDADSKAQAVVVHQYDTVDVAQGATLTAPAWNGATGGIMAFAAKTAVTVEGVVSMSGRGFRGFSHAATCLPSICSTASNGFYGESAAGPSLMSVMTADGHGMASGAGGGGGTMGQDCSSGGGGAYDDGATAGGDGNIGACVMNGMHGGGLFGTTVGDTDLTKTFLFGGAGGEGGPDEDGAYPGAGGNGGGSILIFTPSITLNGPLTADAQNGSDGVVSSSTCSGSGCGMGGGGGGAGGSIRIVAPTATLGTSLVSAIGGTGGSCTCGGFNPGGVGGSGRIQVKATNPTGITMPAFQP